MTKVTISSSIYAPMKQVRTAWTTPADIMQRNHASDDRHCPSATNDLRIGGSFSFTMAAKDKSFSFDFNGLYTQVKENELIEYTMEDGRKVSTFFEDNDCGTIKVTSTFDAETQNPIEMQQAGWQAILDNFKKHVEQK